MSRNDVRFGGHRPLLLLVLASGCKAFFPAPSVMTSVRAPLSTERRARCVMVLLPGAGDTGATFREQGFIDAIQQSGASVDLVAADATLGYYLRGSAPQHVETDVIGPLRAQGYEQLWVLGISMGGYGALEYAHLYPLSVDGVVALAPFLGAESIGDEIRAAGGLAQWKPDAPAPVSEENYQRQLWSWLHQVTAPGVQRPQVFLGFGDDDSLRKQNEVLASALPVDHVFHTAGGHDWAPWRRLLHQVLERSAFRSACAP